jgi:hypothetical protein
VKVQNLIELKMKCTLHTSLPSFMRDLKLEEPTECKIEKGTHYFTHVGGNTYRDSDLHCADKNGHVKEGHVPKIKNM